MHLVHGLAARLLREAATPDDGALVGLLYRFLPDEQAVTRVLVDNPRRLFGFSPA
jgi:hypothetical protein